MRSLLNADKYSRNLERTRPSTIANTHLDCSERSTLVDYWNQSYAMEDRAMIIGDRLRALREQKNFSQGEIEKCTGLLRCYISRVENGHTGNCQSERGKTARATSSCS